MKSRLCRLVDEQATCAAVRAISARGELARYDLLHIATHASLVPKQGMRAHIKLWDADLWLAEVSGLRLGNALVVLSACEGAGAELLPGDEALSLSWAWLAAGATGVLASLWKIGDAGAQRFMQEFYTALGPHGDAARALAETQRAAIARSSGTPGEPDEVWLWASFVLTGGDPADRPRA